jgi:hypothetical protein
MNLLIYFLVFYPQKLHSLLFQLVLQVFRAQLQSQLDLGIKLS